MSKSLFLDIDLCDNCDNCDVYSKILLISYCHFMLYCGHWKKQECFGILKYYFEISGSERFGV